jgi:hypothetical protein
MMLWNELRSKAIEAMRGISGTSEEDERPADPTPIQDLKLDPWLDSHELHLRRSRRGPSRYMRVRAPRGRHTQQHRQR